ncbi:hypothetical protein AB0B66_38385 [Catellatospora sp. NPDC049111]|uniref:hypothetical protein n=1 Tax=Catellatospora sp. NPDC049111 TaxID=3155271 RepID=UPI0033D414A5
MAYLLTGDHRAAEDLPQNALLTLALGRRKARIDTPDATCTRSSTVSTCPAGGAAITCATSI